MPCSSDLSPRNLERMQIVTDALNQKFGWSLPGCGSTHAGPIIGGHLNIFWVSVDTARFRLAINFPGDRLFPPGIRLSLRLPDAEHAWALHIPEFRAIAGGLVAGRAHIDRFNPDVGDLADVVGHGFWDFIVGHIRRDIDPHAY